MWETSWGPSSRRRGGRGAGRRRRGGPAPPPAAPGSGRRWRRRRPGRWCRSRWSWGGLLQVGSGGGRLGGGADDAVAAQLGQLGAVDPGQAGQDLGGVLAERRPGPADGPGCRRVAGPPPAWRSNRGPGRAPRPASGGRELGVGEHVRRFVDQPGRDAGGAAGRGPRGPAGRRSRRRSARPGRPCAGRGPGGWRSGSSASSGWPMAAARRPNTESWLAAISTWPSGWGTRCLARPRAGSGRCAGGAAPPPATRAPAPR